MSRFRTKQLFSDQPLRDYFERKRMEMLRQIERYDGNRLLNTTTEGLVEYFTELGSVEAIDLRWDHITVDHGETKVDVSHRFEYARWGEAGPHFVNGTSVSWHIPFSGDPHLFHCQASTYSTSPPYAFQTEDEVIFEYADPRTTHEAATQYFESERSKLKRYLEWTNRDVLQHNSNCRVEAADHVVRRKDRLLANAELVASLGFPIRARPDAQPTYAIPQVRKKAAPVAPKASTVPFAPEPELSGAVYDQILSIMSNMVRVMEQSPSAFADMGEEDLRTHFLVQLNGQFEGQASAETFHGSGSTDILIRAADKSVFIAECKFWDGPQSVSRAIDQLLDYATWRDAKTALLIFSRNRDFGAVLAQVPAIVQNHPNTKGHVSVLGEGTFRSRLGLRDEPSREVMLTTLVFNVPANRSTSARLKPRKRKRE